jgi:hygromycin-B 4-O-kinase
MEELPQIPEGILQSISEEAGIETLDKMEALEGGRINHVLAATTESGEEVVLRIPRDPRKSGRFEGEVWALERAAEAGVPVPKVLAVKERGEDRFLLETRVPGRTLRELLPNLEGEGKVESFKQIGEHTAQIHTVKTEGFGWLREGGKGVFGTWPEFLEKSATRHMEYLREQRLITQEEEAKIKRFFSQRAPSLSKEESRLVHRDIQVENIMADEEGNVAGVLDFETCIAGDPAYDLAYVEYGIDLGIEAGVLSREEGERFLDAFYDGYGENEIPKGKILLYKTLITCDGLNFAHRSGAPETELCERTLKSYLSRIPRES